MTDRSKPYHVTQCPREADRSNSILCELTAATACVLPFQRSRVSNGVRLAPEISVNYRRFLLEIHPTRYLRDDNHRLA